MRRANIASGVALALFGLVMLVWIIPAQIETAPEGFVSPRLVPNLMMIAVTALAALLAFNNLRASAAPAEPSPITRRELSALARIGAVFALALALHAWVSPLAAGAALIAGALLALGERRPLVLVLMPALILLAVWALFYKVLGTAIV